MTNTPIRLLAEDDRPREKLQKQGRTALSDAELLAIIIGSGTRELSALELAREILHSCGNDLHALGRLEQSDFCRMKGIGKVKAIGILAALELGRRRSNFNERKSKVISSSNSAFAQFKVELSDLSHEEFWAIYLSSGSKLIQKKRISSGGIAGTVADVRMILKAGLDCRATALIVAHNHPSGSLKPSEPDIRLTRKLKDASELMDIRLLDHLIIGLNGYYSFADEGLVF